MPAFAVLQTRWEPLPPERLGPILARTLGLMPFDAARAAREAHGILAERLTRPQADALAAACAGEGLETRVVPQEWLAAVGVPTLVRTLTIRPEGLGVVLGYTGPPTTLAWPSVRLLSAGAVAERHEAIRALAPSPGRHASPLRGLALTALAGPVLGPLLVRAAQAREAKPRSGAAPAPSARSIEMADLFVADGAATRHLRLRAPDLYYAQILGAEDPRDATVGFRLVLARVAERATAAFASPTLEAVLREPGPDGVAAEATFQDIHEFTQYNRWLVQMLGQ